MVRLNIELPEKLRKRMAARAAESGHETVEEYVESLILADAHPEAEEHDAPAHLKVRAARDVKTKLQEGLDSGPATEMTQANWDEIRQHVRRRR